MSTVVFSNGIMASDTRAYSGNGHPIGNKAKIRRLKNGSLVGVTSNVVGFSEAFMAWLDTGGDEDLPHSEFAFDALLIKADGQVFLYCDSLAPAGPLTGEHFTIGSGRKYALGALHAGLTAAQAVEVASGLDQFSGLPVAALALHECAPAPAAIVSDATTEEALLFLADSDA